MQPLTGLRVLDLTRLLPGPWATMLLADLGAEVIKVEGPEGDNSRAAPPYYKANGARESVYFSSVNRNKRSLVLNLKDAADLAEFKRLVAEADAVVESFRPGTAARLGIDYAVLSKLNPRLIYASLSGYGQTGPGRDLAGHDLNITGMTGMLHMAPGHRPAMPGFLAGDYAGASMLAVALLAAIVDRDRRGRGAQIDVSMLDAAVSWTAVQTSWVFANAVQAGTGGAVEGWGGNPRYNIYRTRDGRYVTVSLLERKYWDAFCRHCGRPDLINPDETEADRLTGHRERGPIYRKFLEEIFATKDRDDWIAELTAEHLPVFPVLTMAEVYDTPIGTARGHFQRIPMPRLGIEVPQHGFPFHMTMSDGSDAFGLRLPPPALGEANSDYLKVSE